MEFSKSIFYLFWAIIKRFYILLPGLLLDPFDLAEPLLGISYTVPQSLAWAIFWFGLFIATAWAYHDLRKKVAQESKLREIREKLGKFLIEGQKLLPLCRNEKETPPENDCLNWANNVSEYLESKLGGDYSASFWSSDGLPMGVTTIASQEHRRLESFVSNRLARLQQYLAELRSKK